MTDALFGSWWLPAVLLIVGAVVWYSGRGRSDRRVHWAGAILAGAGALLFVGGFFIVTDARRVDRLATDFVQSVVDRKWDVTRSLLDANLTLTISNLAIPPLYSTRDQFLAGAQEAAKRFGLRSASVSIDETRRQGEMITTTVRIFSNQEATGDQPLPSTWQFDWEKDEKGNWTIHDIRCLRIANSEARDVLPYFPSRR